MPQGRPGSVQGIHLIVHDIEITTFGVSMSAAFELPPTL
jgi:hypothetical protein